MLSPEWLLLLEAFGSFVHVGSCLWGYEYPEFWTDKPQTAFVVTMERGLPCSDHCTRNFWVVLNQDNMEGRG